MLKPSMPALFHVTVADKQSHPILYLRNAKFWKTLIADSNLDGKDIPQDGLFIKLP
jgi:hypothetical protein